jgi:hypothetical protein
VLGISAVSTGAVTASAVCSAGANATADAQVVGLSLLGQALTLDATTPTVSANAGVSVVGLVGAQLHATARRVVSTTATTASASAVLVDLSLTATVPLVGTAVNVNLGTISLAQASCQAPSASTTSMAPATGPTGGGTTVTVTGDGLQNTTGVTFGGVAATSFTVNPAGTTLTAVSPASETAGGVPVVLARPTGNLTAGTFTYVAPTITGVNPPQGTTAGGTSITITGTGLSGATAVTIGGTPATNVVAVNSTTVTATTAAHVAGTVPVVVTLPGADATSATGYTYVTPTSPTVTAMSPTSGPAAGGTAVTLTGTNLATATAVSFGGTNGTITAQTATSLTVTTPMHAVGPVTVTVTNPSGSGQAASPFTFTDDGSGATFGTFSPTTIPTSGGTLTIPGTGLGGATGVTIGSSPVTVTSVTATAITVTVPPSETAGARAVVVQFPAGTRAPGSMTYVAPTITGVSPATGPSAGGTVVTVTGTGLTPTTAVTFGGVPGTVTASSATSLTVTAPAHAPGAVAVAAVMAGADATSAGNAFTYLDDGSSAVVATVTPATSPTGGGGTITVTGTGLAGASGLQVGGVAVGSFTATATTITGTIPASETAGAVPVTLTFPAGTTVTIGSLTYVAPTITAITPAQGLINTATTTVTITGTGFTGATGVTFGGVAATGVTVVSSTSITATAPSRALVGAVDVVVTLPGADATAVGGFAYIAPGAATITGVTPSSGSVQGGESVVVSGTGLDTVGVAGITFGGVPGTVTATSPTSATVTTPAHPVGPVTVGVTNGSGTTSLLPNGYTYLADGVGSSVASIAPATLPTAGGQIVLTGVGLSGATRVDVGPLAATVVSISPDGTTLTATVPPSETATTYPVTVVFPLGTTAAGTLALTAPTLSGIAPPSGSIAGSTLVTLTGTDLATATRVTFGGVEGTDLLATGPGTLTVRTPAHAAGPVAVLVELPGVDPATLTYTYLDDGSGSTATGVSPATLPTSGGTVTVTGTALAGASGITVGGVPVTGFVAGATSISGTVPPSETAGAFLPVRVVFPGGSIAATGTVSLVAPTLTAVSPISGVIGGGNTLTLTGTGLAAATDVVVGGTTVPVVTRTATSVTAVAPAHAAGLVDVSVMIPGADAALVGAYTYLDDGSGASVAGLTPTTVPTTGGTQITITGTGLASVQGVTVGGVAATSVVAAAGTVTAVVPPAETGGGATVTLWFPAGTVVAGSVTYVAPTLTAVTPATGPAGGAQSVTLTGTGFSGVSQVLIGGAPATVTAQTATSVTATTTAHAPGPVDVVAVQTGADAVLVGGYTYLDDGSAATITGLAPLTSPTAGGGTLTISGSGLAGVTGVTIGGAPVTVTGVAAGAVTVTIPPSETAGGQPVVLQFAAGVRAAGTLTYVASTVTSVSPATGPQSGGTGVTITGTNLGAVTQVLFDGVPGTGVVATAGTVTVSTVAHVPGPVTVTLVQPGADVVRPNAYTFLVDGSGAVIASVTPATAPLAGGVPGSITGTGLAAATGVTIGGVPVADLVVAPSGTSITFTVPPGAAVGPAPVVVTMPGGTIAAGTLTYLDDGSQSTVGTTSPGTSPTAGGGTLTVTGTGLGNVTGVSIGGTVVTPTSVTATTVTATIPATETAGTVPVVLQLPAGTLAAGTLTYQAPTITSLTPSSGVAAGGTAVTIAGTGLLGVTAVSLGGVPVASFTAAPDGTSITLTTAPHAAGPATLAVQLPGADAVLANAFTFLEDGSGATVSNLTPATAPTAGGVPVTVTGTGLAGATGLTVGGVAVTGFSASPDGTTVTGTVPASATAGPATVTVTFPAGTLVVGPITYVAPTLTAVSPAVGPSTGGTVVTLTGTGLTGASEVTFGGTAGLGLVVAPDGLSATVTTPAHALGLVDVAVTLPGVGVTLTNAFTFEADGTGAAVTGTTPSTSPLAGGGTLTISGSGLATATGVTIGGQPATITSIVDTEIQVTIPSSAAPGTVAVVVAFPLGTVLAGGLTYVAPTVTAVSPATGPQSGGTLVALTGTELAGTTGVTVGGLPATFTPTAGGLEITTPPHAPGVVDVVVTVGTYPVTLTGAFTYLADGTGVVLPTTVTPATSPLIGGGPGTITGAGLTGAVGVTVGGVTATVGSVSDTLITFTVPTGTAPGDATVQVSFPLGTPVAVGTIRYLDDGSASTVSGISPASVPTTGGTVTITGTGLAGVTGVDVGGVLVTPSTPPTATSVTIVAPDTETPGPVTLTLQFEAGSVVVTPQLTYRASTVTLVDPDDGPQTGGGLVTFTGTDLDGVTQVTFGGVPAFMVGTPTATTVTVLAPSHAPGAVTVVLGQPGADVRLLGGYTYLADGTAANPTGVTPATSGLAGGIPGTITGTGLTGATGVTVGGTPAVLGTVTATLITFTVPASATAGPATVQIVYPTGTPVTVPGGITYLDDGTNATVTSVTPGTSPTSGGGTLTIVGTNLGTATGITVGGTPVTGFVPGSTTITGTIPPAAVGGSVPIVIVFPDGTVDAGDLVYAAPVITGITPAQGTVLGGTTVTILGSGLTGATGITFGGVPGTAITPVTGGFEVTTPAQGPGLVDVVVELPGANAVVTDGFGYVPVGGPFVASLSPTSGPTGGGTTVTITGTGLATTTEVTFGDMPAEIVGVPTATQVVVETPAHTAGTVPVAVTNSAGTGSLPGAFTYVAPGGAPVLRIAWAAPRTGPTSGGQTVVIAGTGFVAGGTGVSFDGIPAQSVTVLSSTALLAVTPPHTEGVVPMMVWTDGVDAQMMTYVYDDTAVAVPAPPTVSGVDPAALASTGGTTVTVTGSGFVPGSTSVFVCGVVLEPSEVAVAAGGGSLTFVAPACDPGETSLLVITPGGSASIPVTYFASAVLAAGELIDDVAAAASGVLAATGTDAARVAPWWALALVVWGAGLLAVRTAVVRRRRRTVGAAWR